ncbi:NAD(P)H-binding [Rhizobium tibeticum]|uniref:NAD(P)H-binding n=1 Tax=Rhizobium tibeticum TaxID=501024 RepID=A0A1H8RD73_9HYPH|nr:short chain dehydrogenase [Rhizobium tibeticum]SEO64316.1 NAD(P)H-binding [Rhizobium tibeticum]
MNILILGATGFIGSATAARLLADGHRVTGLGRNPSRARLKLPDIKWIAADLSKMLHAEDWSAVIEGHDAVVNCAGALQDGLADELAATQHKAMLALYAAAQQARPLIVQISARTNGAAGDLPFLTTKRQADEALAASGLLMSSCARPSSSAATPMVVRRCCAPSLPCPSASRSFMQQVRSQQSRLMTWRRR